MLRKLARLLAVLALVLVLVVPIAGCWNQSELDEYGFVQAVALDKNVKDVIQVSTLFYKPASSGGMSLQGSSAGPSASIVTTTVDSTVFDAIRDIPIHFGRKAKWDHMRVILISENLVRSVGVEEVLDFFRRDHEPRATNVVLITKGEAEPYLRMNPYIESTIGQQMLEMNMTTAHFAAKTADSTMFSIELGLKSESGIAEISYLYTDPKKPKEPLVSGIGLLRRNDPTYLEMIPSWRLPPLMMLKNRYNYGVVKVPCSRDKESAGGQKIENTDAFEVISFKTKVKTIVHDDKVSLDISAAVNGDVGELHCSELTKPDQIASFELRTANKIREEMLEMIEFLQKRKLDALQIADRIHRYHPFAWQRMKKDWENTFAHMNVKVKVQVNIRNVGTIVGYPS